jgi:hypothetical protein
MWCRPKVIAFSGYAATFLCHLAEKTQQLTAPDGSAFKCFSHTDDTKVALMTAMECLPSKLPSCAAADVSGNYT